MIAWPMSGAWLRKVVLGYYQYTLFRKHDSVAHLQTSRVQVWQSVLVRRSQRAKMRWNVLHRRPEPVDFSTRVLHPYPDARFYATHPS